MAIKIPDTLRPDNSTYPIVDSADIKGGVKRVSTVSELNSMNPAMMSEGMLVWVDEKKCYYNYVNGKWDAYINEGIGTPVLSDVKIEELRQHGI